MSGVLITGGTGNVGSRLVKEYLVSTDHHLYLLTRAEDDAAALARIERVLEFWDVSSPEYRARVTPLRGDILEEGFGFTEQQLAEIRREVTIVVHAASNLRLDLTIERARHEILGGTRHAFGIASSLDRLERFAYLSTMEVMGGYQGEISEEFLTNHNIPFYNNYEVAKFESEEFLREKMDADYPVTIFRVSMVVGESTSGKLQDFQSFYMLTEKLILNPDFAVLPDGAPIDAIPVDFLSRCLVTAVASADCSGQIFHLSQGQDDAITFREYRDLVRPLAIARFGATPKQAMLVPVAIHRGLFRFLSAITFGKTSRFFRVQLIFLQFFDLPGTFVNAKTKQKFAELGLAWPEFRKYLPELMKYYFEHRHKNRLPF